jgi:hypothetical protein
MTESSDNDEKVVCGEGTCLYHSGMTVQAREFGRRLSDQHNDRAIMWNAIKDKVPIKYFILLVTFVVGGLGFQLLIYDSIKAVDKKIAVIEYSIQQIETKRAVNDPRP